MTLQDQISEFLETLNREPLTLRTYRNALKQFAAAVGTDADLSLENYKAFLKSLKHASPSTQRVYSTAVRKLYKFFRAASQDDLKDATDHYTREQPADSPVEFDEEAIQKLLAYANTLHGDLFSLRDKAFIYAVDGSGLRISEAVKLNVGDIDWNSKSAIIKGKRGRVAKVRFSDKAIEALRVYLQARSAAIETRQAIRNQPLFACHDVRAKKQIKRISANGIREAIKQRMEEAGIDRETIRIHDLRHDFITTIYRASNNPKLAQELARHKSASLTINRYSHLTTTEADTSYDQIINGK